jgi:DNA-binding NarL/FixJ family response regulator
MRISYFIYEDNEDFRLALVENLASYDDIELKLASSNANRILEDTEVYRPQVILMDIEMPGISGIEAVAKVKARFPGIEILMLTIFDESENVFQSICAGASGYLLKNAPPDEIAAAILDVARGGAPITSSIARKIISFIPKKPIRMKQDIELTERESTILHHLAEGFPYKYIASELKVSVDAVRFHIKNIYRKLQVHSAPEAVSKAIRERLL